MERLKESNVTFDAVSHTYMIGEKALSGITRIIRKHILLDESEAPAFVFEEGKNFHLEVESAMNGFEPANPSERFIKFKECCKNIKFIRSEYIVTDGKDFATALDLLDDKHNIYDIKSNTGEVNELYIRWQLSIEKYLFKLQNGFEAGGLFEIHAKKDECYIKQHVEIPEEKVKKLLECHLLGKPYTQDETEICDIIARLTSQAKQLDATLNAYKEQLMNIMAEDEVHSYKGEGYALSFTPASSSVTFDSTRFKKENPELAEKYSKEVLRKPSISVRFTL